MVDEVQLLQLACPVYYACGEEGDQHADMDNQKSMLVFNWLPHSVEPGKLVSGEDMCNITITSIKSLSIQ